MSETGPSGGGEDERASNRELMWLLLGMLVAGLMIAVTVVLGGGAGE